MKCCTLAPFVPLWAGSCTCSDDSSVCLTQFPQCPQCTRQLIRYKQLLSYRGTTSRSSNERERLQCWHSNASVFGTRKRLSDLMTAESATWPVNFPVNYKASVLFCTSSPAPGRHGKDLKLLSWYTSDMIPVWANLKTAVIYCENVIGWRVSWKDRITVEFFLRKHLLSSRYHVFFFLIFNNRTYLKLLLGNLNCLLTLAATGDKRWRRLDKVNFLLVPPDDRAASLLWLRDSSVHPLLHKKTF